MVGHTGYVLVLTSLLLVHPYMRLKRSGVVPTSEVLFTSTLTVGNSWLLLLFPSLKVLLVGGWPHWLCPCAYLIPTS